MPASSPSRPLDLQLWFGDVLVARLSDVIPHQGTWFASYQQVVTPDRGPRERRLCDYIAFCEEWHRRLRDGDDPDAAEFDRFRDVIESDSWRIPCPDGTELKPDGGPILVEGEASWNHPESEPSRELAAEAVWSRLSEAGPLPADPRPEARCGSP